MSGAGNVKSSPLLRRPANQRQRSALRLRPVWRRRAGNFLCSRKINSDEIVRVTIPGFHAFSTLCATRECPHSVRIGRRPDLSEAFSERRQTPSENRNSVASVAAKQTSMNATTPEELFLHSLEQIAKAQSEPFRNMARSYQYRQQARAAAAGPRRRQPASAPSCRFC